VHDEQRKEHSREGEDSSHASPPDCLRRSCFRSVLIDFRQVAQTHSD
jgi:hypothetical protein